MVHFKKSLTWILAVLTVLLAAGCAPSETEAPAPTEPEMVTHPLMEQYPSFFGLDTANGLTVFAAKYAQDFTVCSLYPTTEEDVDFTPIALGPQTDPATMKEILSWYNLPKEAITVIPFYSTLSSYIAPDLFEEQGMAQLLYELGLGEKPADIQDEIDDSVLPYTLCWSDASDEGLFALTMTYYPITGTYVYKNELTYPAVGIKTRQDLDAFVDLTKYYFSLNGSLPNGTAFNTLIKTYDEAFFENNGLAIVYIASESTSISYKLTDVTVDGEELHIAVTEAKPEGELAQQSAGWFMVVEIPQEVLGQVNYFSAG